MTYPNPVENDILQHYCLCDFPGLKCSHQSNDEKGLFSLNANIKTAVSSNEEAMVNPARERKRKHPIPDISDKISEVYKELQENKAFVVLPRKKGNRGLYKGVSERRSRYVGVTQNGGHWQALINVGRSKKYIGTYNSENEAALTYDFYAFGIHGLKAKTNFKHTGAEIMTMIESFISNENKFVPSLFTKFL